MRMEVGKFARLFGVYSRAFPAVKMAVVAYSWR